MDDFGFTDIVIAIRSNGTEDAFHAAKAGVTQHMPRCRAAIMPLVSHRATFRTAAMLKARACLVLDAGGQAVTPERIELLLRPVMDSGYDFAAPCYQRHRNEGAITHSILYPLTRALYGMRVRYPAGGDFGLSNALFRRCLEGENRETDPIGIATVAIAEGFRVCQSFLGAKQHDPGDPGTDLSGMLEQVVGPVFQLMERYEPVWSRMHGSKPVEVFGFPEDEWAEGIRVDVGQAVTRFRRAHGELGEIWEQILRPGTYAGIERLARSEGEFLLDDVLWVRTVYDFAVAYKRRGLDRRHVLRSLTPLYLARAASFVLETQDLPAQDVEERIETLCRCYEGFKSELIGHWTGAPGTGLRRRYTASPRLAEQLVAGVGQEARGI